MKKIIALSDAVSLALHTMALLAHNPDTLYTTREIAKILSASSHHLAKVIQRLKRGGMIRSSRGPRGGVRIAPGWSGIRLMDIYELMEGPWEPADCLLSRRICGGKGHCMLGTLISDVNEKIQKALEGTSLEELVKSFRIPNMSKEEE